MIDLPVPAEAVQIILEVYLQVLEVSFIVFTEILFFQLMRSFYYMTGRGPAPAYSYVC